MLRPHVLLFAGTESQGRAGLHSDLRALHGFPLQVSSVVTCITAQPIGSLPSALLASTALLEQQLDAALQLGPPAAIKVGLLGSEAAAQALIALRQHLGPALHCPMIIDPVMHSSAASPASGLSSLSRAVWWQLLSLADLVTPNLQEAAWLLQVDLAQVVQRPALAARALAERLQTHVLLKGGHGAGQLLTDTLIEGADQLSFSRPRVQVATRGTGCYLASAIAARLALGKTLRQACVDAGDQLHAALRQGQPPACLTGG
ncbi:bifunctional hydroxymethylpyrimidine kinase/phosphomethylpyrimidine kinase [Pseudomarimonas arenosa]|uniref:Bifunctional hydroxymethylpyrimidine kinase/phosphomethylpyrimidine kinase n=1 Tax=Pseudomarimonas arenosa TaxID=2774145 RepID=A0AAW3ZP10_9GAMM|nr:bifunctional hydroxymethylpyrimidine kinase/phosphomethylpyrimidine kinase [Pseudomarimonas arenosa]MBD8526011.1 bifunctional hydroxymethylpyrimidine kinase/phosphomethylpyrimidine kinase [Pseudomarimonas arenosa]